MTTQPRAGGQVLEGSFEEFYNRHRRSAYRKARGLVGSHEAAEDVVAEAFSRLWHRWGDGTLHHPASYLARTVHNACMDHFRKLARERSALARATAGAQASESAAMAAVEARHVVDGLLQKIPEAQRRTVSLRYLDDLTERHTAEVLGVAVGTVKSTAARGLHRLRTLPDLGTAA